MILLRFVFVDFRVMCVFLRVCSDCFLVFVEMIVFVVLMLFWLLM